MAMLLGLTGGIGSGKTAASDRFAEHGINVIDADMIAREVVAPGTLGLKKIAEHFGQAVITDTGELKRSKLRDIIFADTEKKHWLEQLTHPLIRQTIEERITTSTTPYTLLVAPLLLEGDLHQRVDKIIVVDCTVEQQLHRASQRDDSKLEKIQAIIDQQVSREERLNRADFVLDNQGTQEQLIQQVDQLHQTLLTLDKTNTDQ